MKCNNADKEHCTVSQDQAFSCVWGMKTIWCSTKVDIFIPITDIHLLTGYCKLAANGMI